MTFEKQKKYIKTFPTTNYLRVGTEKLSFSFIKRFVDLQVHEQVPVSSFPKK